MANTLMKLGQIQLGAADTLLYQAPPSTTTTITGLTICNTDAAERTVRLHHVDSAGGIAAANAVYYDYPVASKRTLLLSSPGWIVQAGQALRGLASVGAVVTVTLWGIESR